jgi:hypothetical protein
MNASRQLMFPAHRAGLPGKEGSSFVRLTMTAHHDKSSYIPDPDGDLPVLSARPEFIEGCRRAHPGSRLTGFAAPGKKEGPAALFK